MRQLTPRQRDVLALIRQHLDQTGFPPTRAEIATALGFRSANAAEDHLKALARKGIIELCPGTSRGIRLLAAAHAELGLPPGTRVQQAPSFDPGMDADSSALSRGALPDQGPEGALGPNGRIVSGDTTRSSNTGLTLPLIGRVAAGQPILAESHIESNYHVDASLFDQHPDYLLRIRGESMRDAGMHDGDLLAVKSAFEAHNGQIVVARIGNEVTVKRLRHNRAQRTVELLPENPDYQPIVLHPGADEFQIEGIAVGLIRQRWS